MGNKNEPFFSVVIPTYNRVELIKKSIASVMRQTYTNWELIIADDCSTDHTENIVQAFQNEKIKFFKNKKNMGNAGTRNLGARHAKGKYVAYLDSDDQFHASFLEKMYDLILKNNYPGFLWCNVNIIDKAGKNLGRSIPSTWNPLKQEHPYLYFLNGLKFGTSCGFTVRNDCFKKTGFFDENIRTAVDTDFILRIVQDYNFNYTKTALIDHYDHVGQRVRKDTPEKLKSYKIMFNKHKTTILKHKELKAHWFNKLMWISYHNKEKKQARKYLFKSLNSGNFKSFLTASLFEIFSVERAVLLHKRISGRNKIPVVG